MKISVVIPMFNSEKTIFRALVSVLNQTYKDFEIIMVDDGSVDDTKKIVEEFLKDKDVTYKYIFQENNGPSSARNNGVKNASGEYIAFLDSDDAWHPQKLEILVKILKNSSIGFIGHGYTLENNFHIFYEAFSLEKKSFIQLLLKNFAVTPSVVIRKDIFEYFDETMHYAEDHELWLRTSSCYETHYLNLPLTMIGRPPLTKGGLSSNKWAMRKGEMKMYINIVKYKKVMIFCLPALLFFSLTKHLRNLIKDFFAKKCHANK